MKNNFQTMKNKLERFIFFVILKIKTPQLYDLR